VYTLFDKRAGTVLVDQLIEWKIDHVYGLPGDSINQLMEDLRKAKDQIDFYQVRHEEVAALAAKSYAKLTGKIGVCMSIAGPGAIHLMNGLYDAKGDSAPMLVLVGQVDSDKIGTDSFQEINLERMFDDVSVYNKRVASEEQLPNLLNQAIRTAYAKKGVAVLSIPDDIIARKIKKTKKLTSSIKVKPRVFPQEDDLNKALEQIKGANRPIILAGNGASKAREELKDFAKKIASPVVVTLPGKGVVPDDHPYCLGHLGQIGTKPAYEAMQETDLLILVGTSFPYRDFLPEDAPAIQIDLDPTQIGKRYPIDIGLVGEAASTLQWLNSRLSNREDRTFLKKNQERMNTWNQEIRMHEIERTTPLKAPQVVGELQKAVEKDAVLSVDVGNVTVWMARHFRMTEQQDLLISSWMATMGCGLPGAIASKIACPERQAIAVVGDGGFSMVMHDFVTAVKYELPIVVVILNNSKIGMIKYEQQEMGHLEYETELAEIDFAKFAESCGGIGYRVEQHEQLSKYVEQAVQSKKPVILDVVIEDQAPLPGKISYDQAINYTEFLVKKFFKQGKIDGATIKKGFKHLTQ
jgi:pyruvate oxidase